ncbi:MAG: DNA-processing protein DprA [Chlorobiaceae bacterium]
MTKSVSIEKKTLLLALTLIPGIGATKIKSITNHLPNLTDILHVDIAELMKIPGIGSSLAQQVYAFLHNSEKRLTAINAAEKQITDLHRYGATLVTILDVEYPPLLLEIYDPPPCLFVRGKIPASQSLGIAVVGTRLASQYGKQSTEKLCQGLVTIGAIIFSGLAYGIDMTAHNVAINNGGITVAVLATGIDTIYTDPKGKIWPKIIEQGALISEEWLGSELLPGKFPKRNRIISGISSGTLVIESDIKGGALITASYALEQNREVFAVPGSIFSRTSRGTNKLIQQGQAKAVMHVDDIIVELWPQFAKKLSENRTLPRDKKDHHLSDLERAIMQILKTEPVHIDTLATLSGIDISTLLVHLFELELKAAIVQLPGQFFQKNYN